MQIRIQTAMKERPPPAKTYSPKIVEYHSGLSDMLQSKAARETVNISIRSPGAHQREMECMCSIDPSLSCWVECELMRLDQRVQRKKKIAARIINHCGFRYPVLPPPILDNSVRIQSGCAHSYRCGIPTITGMNRIAPIGMVPIRFSAMRRMGTLQADPVRY